MVSVGHRPPAAACALASCTCVVAHCCAVRHRRVSGRNLLRHLLQPHRASHLQLRDHHCSVRASASATGVASTHAALSFVPRSLSEGFASIGSNPTVAESSSKDLDTSVATSGTRTSSYMYMQQEHTQYYYLLPCQPSPPVISGHRQWRLGLPWRRWLFQVK